MVDIYNKVYTFSPKVSSRLSNLPRRVHSVLRRLPSDVAFLILSDGITKVISDGIEKVISDGI